VEHRDVENPTTTSRTLVKNKEQGRIPLSCWLNTHVRGQQITLTFGH